MKIFSSLGNIFRFVTIHLHILSTSTLNYVYLPYLHLTKIAISAGLTYNNTKMLFERGRGKLFINPTPLLFSISYHKSALRPSKWPPITQYDLSENQID